MGDIMIPIRVVEALFRSGIAGQRRESEVGFGFGSDFGFPHGSGRIR
jgi:hypothetical protein